MQKFHFAKLYNDNKEAVSRHLSTLWCGIAKNASQKAYHKKLREIIDHIFAPDNAVPLVQTMTPYESVHSVSTTEAEALVGGLWQKSMPKGKYWAPYEHQYQSWNSLLNEKKSIVVTTGTGSGKTECFMMPLVHDLLEANKGQRVDRVQAIFLYPLNALMEDQKERLEKLVAGTPLKYAVYNGDLPDKAVKKKDRDYERIKRKIDMIKGNVYDSAGHLVETKFPNAIATREELRNSPANILLTNPTMLEYILLRKADESLINPNFQSLRWIVIDETHTYTGAGAAEIAMLLRRVLMAFNVKATEVRFATSSATIGNGGAAQRERLQQFISGISGLPKDEIKVIQGKRKEAEVPDDEYKPIWLRLLNENTDGYIPLNKLVEGKGSIAEKLEVLDRMCNIAEERGLDDLRMKVHYFYRVPNGGLFADISRLTDGSFELLTENKDNKQRTTPLLELQRCKKCGEYLAVANADYSDNTFSPLSVNDSDMFEMTETSAKPRFIIFSTSECDQNDGKSNIGYEIVGNQFLPMGSDERKYRNWHVVGNINCCCPYCGTKLTKQKTKAEKDAEMVEQEIETEEDKRKMRRFRIAPDFISRLIAPSTLDQMTSAEGEHLHHGQQYISFVDSRQNAARATIKQNLEEERFWVYSTIFNKLNELAANSTDHSEEIAQLKASLPSLPDVVKPMVHDKIKVLEADGGKNYLTWAELVHLMKDDDKNMSTYCRQFAERSELSTELDEDGNLKEETINRYAQSILSQLLGRRPQTAAAPETMGLFTSHYPKLEPAATNPLPDAVAEFNNLLKDGNIISSEDWSDLLKTFMDFTVRSNQSVYLKMRDDDPIDIFGCERFDTRKASRRPVNPPRVGNSSNPSRIVKMLANLVALSQRMSVSDSIRIYGEDIQKVLDALWDDLTSKYDLITRSTHYDSKRGQHVLDDDVEYEGELRPQYRLNLADLAFKLYGDVYLCDANTSEGSDDVHVKALRPIAYSFKGFSPYQIGKQIVRLDAKLHENWTPYTLGKGKSRNEVHEWAKINRRLLWENGLWGEDGEFADHLDVIYEFPDLFIQAEHTAQVDKYVSRQVQHDFKNHDINILACSTTMEMGVDLGDLELVMMTSVPPMPSNYKQRAGRSGRRGQPRSAAVTLCGSDVVGLRTLVDPMENVIMRLQPNPTVDLQSAQVVQRHINSFLVREFGVFDMGDHGGSVMQNVIDYYTHYYISRRGDTNQIDVKLKSDNTVIDPSYGLGDPTGTPYEKFNEECAKPLEKDLRDKINELLRDTIFDGKAEYVKDQARIANERCYTELDQRVADLGDAYKKAKSSSQQNFMMMKFIEPLRQRLLSYWATHRFTPNANMPVNVVEFDVNTDTKFSPVMKPSNPSYPLRTALAQYVPGYSIARDGNVRIVRGVRYTNFFSPEKTFKTLYHDKNHVVIDRVDEISNPEDWKVSDSSELTLIQPTEYIPDMNETATRILEPDEFTKVSAQLIGAEEWNQKETEPHLFDARNNRESGNAQILYYNEGIGYGFCHCIKCGRTVMEYWTATKSKKLPPEMNPEKPKNEDEPPHHLSLVRKSEKGQKCIGCNSRKNIKRNAVLGDLIQTDYTEIRIRHKNHTWINDRSKNLNLLTTLGVLFTQALSEDLNIERSDLDFTITPNAHICVFDVNPGGSGYANQLSEMDRLKKIIKKSQSILAAANGNKEAIIDRNSLYSLNYLDLEAAAAWLQEEIDAQGTLPAPIARLFPTATEVSLLWMERRFGSACRDAVIFFGDNYSEWDYDADVDGWKGAFFPYFGHNLNAKVCIAKNSDAKPPYPVISMLQKMNGWAENVVEMENPFKKDGIYPLIYIDGYLYFTNNPDHLQVDNRWGNCTIYYAEYKNIAADAKPMNLVVDPAKAKIFFLKPEEKYGIIDSKRLGKILAKEGGNLVSDFITEAKDSDNPVVITYQDEHLKSAMGMIIALQVMKYFIDQIGRDFTLNFRLEQYEENSTSRSFTANFQDSRKRDEYLADMVKKWRDELSEESHGIIYGTIPQIESVKKRTLEHWRQLSITCGSKTLSIYPDGGFANGWGLDTTRTVKYLTRDNVDAETNIPLKLSQKIKFDVTLED